MRSAPSTFMFMLRWNYLPLIGGIVMLFFSYHFLSYPGDPPGLPFQSVTDMIAFPAGVVTGCLGAGLILYAWASARSLRNL